MEARSDLNIRIARHDDFDALTAIEQVTFGKQGISPYGAKYFEAWLQTNPEGFLVAEKEGTVSGYAYTQTVKFDPWRRPSAVNYDTITDHGFTRKTHDPSGNSCQCISGAAVAPGSGRALLKESVQRQSGRGIRYYFTFTRMANFDAWVRKYVHSDECADAVQATEQEMAVWYALENGRMTRGMVWPEVQNLNLPQLPRLKKLDSSLGPQLMVHGLGLLDVLPGCMTDPMSRNYAALLVKELTT